MNGITAVNISHNVIVAQDESGNFTMIAKAFAFMSDATSTKENYFAIYIAPGVYLEYVIEDDNEKMLIMIGAGMDSM